jgi:hypothetical protein
MKRTSFAAIAFLSCLNISPLKASPAERITLEPLEASYLEIPSARGLITLDIPSGVTALHPSFEQDYIVLTWTSANPAQGMLTLPSGRWNLTLSPGKAALIVSPEGELSRMGAVEAYSTFICGPQGARCPVMSPEWKNPGTYPCGPQGAVCSAEGPTVDLSEPAASTGPN